MRSPAASADRTPERAAAPQSSAERLAPPLLTSDILVRSALVETLRQRFDRRAITLVAGPGFGKSTLMAQAFAVNRLAPEGDDRWLRCNHHDAVGSHFVTGLAAAVGVALDRLRHDVDVALDEVLGHIASAWPAGLCLFLDDVHLVQSSPAAPLVRRLITDAPNNLHFVLASRQPIAGLSLRRSRGDVLDLDEDDLRLSDTEIAEMAAYHDTPVDVLQRAAGWPALANVMARHGTTDLAGWETALDGLDQRARRAVAELVVVGGGTVAALEATLTDPPPLTELVQALPMVSLHTDGSVVPHQLWSHVIEGLLTEDATRAVQARMARWLLDNDELEGAATLATAAEHWVTLRAVFVAACSRGHAGPPVDVISSWLDRAPATLAETPEVLLLRGVSARATQPFDPETRDLLEAAMEGFRATNHVTGEIAAIAEYAYVARIRGERERFSPILIRLIQLDAEGHREATAPVRLLRALLAEATGPDELVLAELDAILPGSLATEWMAAVEYLRAQMLLNLGRTGAAADAGARSASLGGPEFLGGFYAARVMRWFDDEPEEALELPRADVHAGATPVDLIYGGLYTALVDAYAGSTERARANLEIATRIVGTEPPPTLRAEVATARAAVSVAEGDEVAAAAELEIALAAQPFDRSPASAGYVRFLALVYVLVPRLRATIDEADLGPSHCETRDLARLVVAVRAGSIPSALPGIAGSARATASRLPLGWAAEVAAALTEAGHPEGPSLASGLASLHGTRFRATLRAAAADSRPGASRLLRSVTIDTGASIEISLLGPPLLRVDGAEITDGEWRRRSVRDLLVHLAGRGDVGREHLCVALWPDASRGSAERNLRATLAHLTRLLEPHRPSEEAPFVLRAERGSIALIGPPHVTVDVLHFEQLVDQADRVRTSTPSNTLDLYREALDLWRGPPYEGLEGVGWVPLEQDRLQHRFVTASVRAAEIHLAAGEAADALLRAADCLQVEPWSEEAHRLLVAAHLASDDIGSARRAADRTVTTLAELGLTPGPETRMVLELVRKREGRIG